MAITNIADTKLQMQKADKNTLTISGMLCITGNVEGCSQLKILQQKESRQLFDRV